MDGDSLTRVGMTLGLLLGIPGLLLFGLRRLGVRLPGQADGGGRLGIVSRLPIDAKHSLLLVRRDTREQLILLGPTGATVLEGEVTLTPAERIANERRERIRTTQAASNRAALQLVGTGAERWLRRITEHAQPSFPLLLAQEVAASAAARPVHDRTA